MGADAAKHIPEIFKWINLTQLANGNQAVDDSENYHPLRSLSGCHPPFK